MRPLLKWITASFSLAAGTLLLSSPALAQGLQWQHHSRVESRAAAAASRPAPQPVRERPARAAAAKKPVVRQPQQFKLPSGAEPMPRVAAAPKAPEPLEVATSAAQQSAARAARVRDGSVQSVRRQQPTVQYPPSSNQRFRKQPNAIGAASLVDEVIPAQWAGPIGAPDEVVYEGPAFDGYGEYVGDPSCGFAEPGCGIPGDPGCGDLCEPGCGCGEGCGGEVCYSEPSFGCGHGGCGNPWHRGLGGCGDRGCIPILWIPPINEIVMFGGVQGFKGPLDFGRDSGNFGFHEGFNIGGRMAWIPWPGLGYQFGYRATHSQLHGDSTTGDNSPHTQHFITTGLFRRKPLGVQYGVVWDMLRDERQRALDFGQIRGEIGFKHHVSREWGFAFTAHANDNQLVRLDGEEPSVSTFQASDQFLLYYRFTGDHGGEARGFGGLDSDGSGILGADFRTPLNDRWSLEGGWTYLIPDGESGQNDAQSEAWNIGLQIVWHYGLRAGGYHRRPYRPLFNVADNGSLIVVD